MSECDTGGNEGVFICLLPRRMENLRSGPRICSETVWMAECDFSCKSKAYRSMRCNPVTSREQSGLNAFLRVHRGLDNMITDVVMNLAKEYYE